jgi:DNA-binding SARP family transcriptional activator/tetratricopeptide (TPR) repeat protein
VGDTNGSLRFELLGSPRAYRSGEPLALGWPRQQAVLVALLVRAGQLVSRDELADAVWGADPPVTAANVVHGYVARLRKILELGRPRRAPGRVLTSAGRGYVLHLEPGQLDIEVAERQLQRARVARDRGDLPECVAALDAAVALWRGTPLAGVPGPLAEIERARLVDAHLAALEDRAEALLRMGRAAGLAGELSALAAGNPYRERLAGLLMRALYQGSRQADALTAYQRTRQRLVDELGVEPGPYLQGVHRDILRNGDAAGASRPDTSHRSPMGAAQAAPQQLPPAVRHFAGRRAELEALEREAARAAATVVISAIGGTAGVGKTALAIRFAHQVAGRFDDGQLYVNLRGFGPSGGPVSPGEAIRGFLDALAVPPERIPRGLGAQTGLYRSLLAGKRMLLVLDNARDENQVRPLLPGSPGCLVIVTSRNQLTGLAAAEGAHLLNLDVLTEPEARELLARRFGHQRTAAEQRAAGELIELCAHLPLALALVAALASARRQVPIATFVTELRQAGNRLDLLDAGDAATSVRAVFSWSYRNLGAAAARMFRLLGIHRGPDISVPAAASLAGVPAAAARAALAELTRAHLLAEHAPGRFAFHDLLRAYAAEQAEFAEDDAARRAAIHRVLDHYLHTAHAAALMLHPGREALTLATPRQGVTPEDLTGHRQALAWYQAEHQVLLAAVALAADEGFDTHAWQLPWSLVTFLYRRGHWDDWAATQRTALAAARRHGDRAGEARAQLDLGYIGAVSGSYPDAHMHLREALILFRQADDRAGQARVHNALATALEREGHVAEALSHARISLALYRTAGNRAARANALTEVSWLNALLGNHEQALSHGNEALGLHLELSNLHGEAGTWDSLGYANHQLGRYAEAITCYTRALVIRREIGDRQHEADTLTHLGDTYCAAGNTEAAYQAWEQALSILDDLRHPHAENIRVKLVRSECPC